LSIGYLGSLFFTNLIEPFESESAGVLQINDSLLFAAAAIALAVFSGSGVMASFGDEDRDNVIDDMKDDYVDISLSAEKGLMDIWDQQFERKKSSDNDDDD